MENGLTSDELKSISSFIEAMDTYSKTKHAEIVYGKCIKADKLQLALKVAYKYNLKMVGHSDTVMAVALAMMPSKTKYNEKTTT